MRTPILQIGLLLLALPEVDASAAERASAPVHQFGASPQGLSVNCYVVEGRRCLVAIDSALTVSDSKALRAKVDALGKPLRAILLTHGHPDHYNGVVYLMEGKSVPVYATERVAKDIRHWDWAKEKQWKPVFGADWPPQRKFADHEVQEGDKLAFDELEFVVHDLGPGESYADS